MDPNKRRKPRTDPKKQEKKRLDKRKEQKIFHEKSFPSGRKEEVSAAQGGKGIVQKKGVRLFLRRSLTLGGGQKVICVEGDGEKGGPEALPSSMKEERLFH